MPSILSALIKKSCNDVFAKLSLVALIFPKNINDNINGKHFKIIAEKSQ